MVSADRGAGGGGGAAGGVTGGSIYPHDEGGLRFAERQTRTESSHSSDGPVDADATDQLLSARVPGRAGDGRPLDNHVGAIRHREQEPRSGAIFVSRFSLFSQNLIDIVAFGDVLAALLFFDTKLDSQ